MGTSNFYRRNSSRIFSIFMDREVPMEDEFGNDTGETRYESPDEWEIDDEIGSISDDIAALKEGVYERPGTYYGSNRSYSSLILGSLEVDRTFYGGWIQVKVIAIMTSGYYEGANLDWVAEIHTNGSGEQGLGEHNGIDSVEIDHIAEDFHYYDDLSEKQAARAAIHAHKWAEKQQAILVAKLEAIYANYADNELQRVATFSNGETIYQSVK